MSINEFIALDETERAITAYSGTLLDVINLQNKDYMLYSVGNFFVEVIYEPKGNKITRIRPFRTTIQLEKYYQHYTLPELA